MSAVHTSWTDQWAPSLINEDLRAGMLDDKRFATRIENDLLREVMGCDADLAVLETTQPEIDDLMEQLSEETLLLAGLFWSAPALAVSLRPLEAVAEVTPTPARLRMIMLGRDHDAAPLVETPKTAEDLRRAGYACLAVWMQFQPDLTAARLTLRVDCADQPTSTDPQADNARYTAMRTALDIVSEVAQ